MDSFREFYATTLSGISKEESRRKEFLERRIEVKLCKIERTGPRYDKYNMGLAQGSSSRNHYDKSGIQAVFQFPVNKIWTTPAESPDIRRVIQFKYRMEHEIGYLNMSFESKKHTINTDSNRVRSYQITHDGFEADFHYSSSFPLDGIIQRNSWFFESESTHTYTPGVRDIEYIDKKNIEYIIGLEAKKASGSINKLEEIILAHERENYADVFAKNKPKKSSNTYRPDILSASYENEEAEPSLLFGGKSAPPENVSVAEARQKAEEERLQRKIALQEEREKQESERAVAKQRKEEEKRERELALQKEREQAKQLHLNESLIKLFEDGVGPVSIRTLQSFIDQKADINYQSKEDGYTALMLAVDRNDTRAAEYLLKSGANTLLINKYNAKASDIAQSNSPIWLLLKIQEESICETTTRTAETAGILQFGITAPGAKAARDAQQNNCHEEGLLKSIYS